MKQIGKLILTLVLPLTIIFFGTIIKWRYVHIDDLPNDFLLGFPLPFICNSWGSSMSLQIFIEEFLFDFLIYFILNLTIVLLFDKYVKSIIVGKVFKFVLFGFSTLTLMFYGLIFLNHDNRFKIKSDFMYKEIRSGYKFIWQEVKT